MQTPINSDFSDNPVIAPSQKSAHSAGNRNLLVIDKSVEAHIDWKDRLPAKIKAAISLYSQIKLNEIATANLNNLIDLLKNPSDRLQVVESLSQAESYEYHAGPKLALIFALLKSDDLEVSNVAVILKQLDNFPKDREFFALAGRVIEGLGDSGMNALKPEIIENALPAFLNMKSYGSDSRLESWENVFANIQSPQVAEAIYGELNQRAFRGARSGYSHLIHLINKSDLDYSGPIIKKLVLETFDPQKMEAPKLFARLIAHETFAIARSAILFAGCTYFMGWESFTATRLPYIALLLPQITAIVRFAKEQRRIDVLANSHCMDTKVVLAQECLHNLILKAESNGKARDFLNFIRGLNFLDKQVLDYITVKK